MKVPSYSHHKSTGQAYVKLRGKFIYLGKYGTEASRRKYEQVIGEYLSNRRQLPATAVNDKSGITVGQLFANYLEHCRDYYQRDGEPTQEYDSHVYLRNKVEPIASLPANEVTPATIEGLRRSWIQVGNTRKYINKSVGRLVRMYKWGVSKAMVDVEVWQRLTSLSSLKSGRSKARETAPIKPADDATFETACEHMPDETADMARIQRLTGARPGELWILRPCDVDRSGDVWTYTPKSHKTQHHGKDRRIWIGPKSQKLLLPYLLRPADELCFRSPTGRPWDRHSFRKQIHLACGRAGLDTFNPNQLRHSAATEIRQRFGLDGAQVALGHANADVTQLYAEADKTKAAMIAKELG